MRIDDPACYRVLVRQLIEGIRSGHLEMQSGTCPLEALLDEGSAWPEDIVSHYFCCTQCGQRFVLSVDTYHGSGERRQVQ